MAGTDATSSAVDEEIYSCLDLDNPKSFFLFAGAGSGKTRSLVETLKRFRKNNIARLKKNGQKIAVITYTNAACDEIKSRLEFDLAFHVSTIHSFAWNMINPYTHDIRKWLATNLEAEITDLTDKQSRARSTTTKTYKDRARKIELKNNRLNLLPSIKKFTYNPNGDSLERDSLNHEEVIKITTHFIQHKPLMQSILIRKYPIILIDESQDTKKELVDAFFEVQEKQPGNITLGLFGDTMQRIYTDGKIDLGQNIPDTWAKPAKIINYRCPKRVITLINKIRSGADDQTQEPYKDNDGCVRLFIVDVSNPVNKANVESDIASKMAELTDDKLWEDSSQASVKILTLEHHMAANRGGFSDFFDPFYSVNKLKTDSDNKIKTGLLDGKLPGVSLFAKQVLPLVKAKQKGDEFAVSRIMRDNSPIIKKDALKKSTKSLEEITKAKNAVNALYSLWSGDADPSLNEVLKEVFVSGIFLIPDTLLPIANRLNEDQECATEEHAEEAENDPVIEAWDTALQCKFSQFEEYVRYISDESRFGTHQGIKGLQFPRVMVILDDDEARGFMFSYDKLFGAVEPTVTDLKNLEEGKETSIDRTRRLFYVTCSRAEESLAIVAYTQEPQKVNDYVLEQGWFDKDEIIQI
jgi:DNA helicase-2/ATP-dependent DNA helicase PcrA